MHRRLARLQESIRTAMLVALLAILAACTTAPPATQTAAVVLDVVSFNLYHDREPWPPRRALIVEELRRLRPDAIVLQEVLQHDSLPNQAEDLARALGYQAYFISIDPPDKARRYGNAILTRHPVLARGWQPLRPLADSRSAGWVRIDLGGQAVNIYATHLHHKQDAAGRAMRSEQVADLLAFVERTAGGMPSVIAGDFNAAAGNPELAPLDRDYFEAFTRLHPDDTRPTLNPHYFKNDRRRIDHVHAGKTDWIPLQAEIVLDDEGSPGVWPSDHFGMRVRLQRR